MIKLLELSNADFDGNGIMNWTYFIVYTNTKGLDTSSQNLVNPLQNNKFYGYTTVNNINMCMMISS